nr:lamin tail domain-containing protein [Brumimicrobium aurantiacum]
MISQYIETNSGSIPKGIEIYNHSSNSIDLSSQNISISQGTNGDPCSTKVTINSGVIGPNQVWVVGSTDLVNFAINGNDIAGVTDYGFIFNGDDALELYLDGVLMDVIGECSNDPGSSWDGSGVSTANQNIAIKPGICTGTTTYWTDPSIRFEFISNGSTMTGFGEAPACNSNTISTTFSLNYIAVNCSTEYNSSVSFSTTGSFNSGNEFNAYISDMNGSFLNSDQIGSISLSGTNISGNIPITIPSNYNAGSNYRIRVESNSPTIYGSNNGHDIEIDNTYPCLPVIPDFGGIVINEFSNGPEGAQEYFELVVLGECGSTTDIREYIIDDNNGEYGNEGISDGHLKLTNDIQWSGIAVGSIIVIYNSSSGARNPLIPADDPTDSNSDSVYIIPYNNTTFLEPLHEFPNASDSTYSPNTAPAPTLTSWPATIGLNNDNDAVQTRKPNGDYFFGLSYGELNNGGIDGTKLSDDNMQFMNGYFNNGDFRNINNWNIGNASAEETPGSSNSVENEKWIKMLRSTTGNCGLIALQNKSTSFTAERNKKQVLLKWISSMEIDTDFYTIYHSNDGINFKEVTKVKALGKNNNSTEYSIKHAIHNNGIQYYKLTSENFEGIKKHNQIISINIKFNRIYYDRQTRIIHFPEKGNYRIYSITGRTIKNVDNQSSTTFDGHGIFFIHNLETRETQRLYIQ